MSARPDNWMPIFWGDYARDTGHLDATGHGAYLMLIKHYWCSGEPLYDDDDELWRIACCNSKADWLRLRPKIVRLFQSVDGRLCHKRIDAELRKASASYARRVAAGRGNANKRWQSHANGNANGMATPFDEDGVAMPVPVPARCHDDGEPEPHSKKGRKRPSQGRGNTDLEGKGSP